MSSSRLHRVQEAAKQLQANKAASLAADAASVAAEALGAEGSVQIERQVIENGSDLAFAMDEGGQLTLWIGRVEIMLGRNKSPVMTVMFLEDAKLDGISVVCTWFEQVGDGTLVLGSVRDLARYSATSCLSIVDLKLVDGNSTNKYKFADPACRANLLVALQALAEPVVGIHETSAEAEQRRVAAEDARSRADLESSAPTRVHVSRAPGKRNATAAVSRP